MSLGHGASIVREGLILHLDAANSKSYPGSGTTWYDLSNVSPDAVAVNLPTYVSNGPQSYWQFDGTDDEFHAGANETQEYRDLFLVLESQSGSGLEMVFGKYDNQDDSFRLNNDLVRGSGNTDGNDWQFGSEDLMFVDGVFGGASTDVSGGWHFIRSYRSNTSGFGTSFRYEISSSFMNRRFTGKLAVIMCYNRQLTSSEVRQNYEALRGRYGV